MRNIVIIGISDVADRFIRIIERYKLYNVIGCAVDKQYLPDSDYILLGDAQRNIWNIDELKNHIDIGKDMIFVAMLFNHLNEDRKNLYLRLKQQGFRFGNIISPLASVRNNDIGENCFIGDFVVVHEGVKIGNNVIIKDLTVIGAYSKIEDHVFLSGCTAIGGRCCVGKESFIGMNATIYTGNCVGEKCLVNAGISINKDIPDYAMVTHKKQNYDIRIFDREIMNESIVAKHKL
ncbi:MAG: hypothetical protein K2K32_04140 [Muribaculaceae bacterium]|nr:hypothetical protein [Muribaculaceae bacterium]